VVVLANRSLTVHDLNGNLSAVRRRYFNNMLRLWPFVGLLILLIGCESPPALRVNGALGRKAQLPARDFAFEFCTRRVQQQRTQPASPGTPRLDALRAEILGRALAEPVLFLSAPKRRAGLRANLRDARRRLDKLPAARRVGRILSRYRHRPVVLRALLLREGYLYSEDPLEAFALVKQLRLAKLFRNETIWHQRGAELRQLVRDKQGRQAIYRYVDGPFRGQIAKLLLFDRVAIDRLSMRTPLHRELKQLRNQHGFDRIAPQRLTAGAIVAKLRFGSKWLTALLEPRADRPARLELSCLAAPEAARIRARAVARQGAAERRAIAALHRSVDALVAERLPFDRPRGEKDHLSDGQLRPQWNWAYKSGRHAFSHEEQSYAVFDRDGRPRPPQMCIDFVLDSFERAAGTWYQPRGKRRERVSGRLDFNALGIRNRAGVLAFEKFAKSKPKLFDATRFVGRERIAFRERSRFFAFLVEHADRFMPGDIVSIQGPKRDGIIHQHAILIVDVDPISGMPHRLADQMSKPRLRTWEGIMAEAPRRALLYQVRLRPQLLRRLDPSDGSL